MKLSATLAEQVRDWRRRPGQHTLATLIQQRFYQIACSYEDQNNATTLRHDPLLKQVCGRLENAVDRTSCYRLARALREIYLRERGRSGQPVRILLDIDSTDDPVHGAQESAAYHGYFRQHMYHPLLIFDGDTNQLITAVL